MGPLLRSSPCLCRSCCAIAAEILTNLWRGNSSANHLCLNRPSQHVDQHVLILNFEAKGAHSKSREKYMDFHIRKSAWNIFFHEHWSPILRSTTRTCHIQRLEPPRVFLGRSSACPGPENAQLGISIYKMTLLYPNETYIWNILKHPLQPICETLFPSSRLGGGILEMFGHHGSSAASAFKAASASAISRCLGIRPSQVSFCSKKLWGWLTSTLFHMQHLL